MRRDSSWKELSEEAGPRRNGGLKSDMYLVTWSEKEGRIEASLGGRVTSDEMAVFIEELHGVLETLSSRPYLLMLDHSLAKRLDASASAMLDELKDFCLAGVDNRILTIVADDDEVARCTSERLQHVLEGRETISAYSESIAWIAEESDEAIVLKRAV